ncbi:MAG: prolipoprotein diacylglyceryl transferase [Patescibacteria group bacterium]|nr:prolipoprotein diacylglyceryl transferase [Patescibacteria group bacterium]
MIEFWHNLPLLIDPIAFHIGSFGVRWYSLSYLVGFITIYSFLHWRVLHDTQIQKRLGVYVKKGLLEDMFIFLFFGLVVGARLGYLFFYDLSEFIAHPLNSLLPFQSGAYTGFYGLSYHGGLIGIALAGFLLGKKYDLSFSQLANFAIPAIPIGYMWGRIGNFLSGELFGRPTDSNIGMNFRDGDGLSRHPSQLYEAFGEGLLLFLIFWPLRNSKKLQGKFLGLYLIGYGIVRFIIEFFRQPDRHIGTALFGLTVGQLLCFCMTITGIALLIYSKKNEDPSV